MGSFVRVVEQELQTKWDETSAVQEKWDTLKTALCDGAKAELGYEDKKQPDWFRESEKDLKSLFSERNRLYVLWISTSKDVYKAKYRRTARQAMRGAKDKWFQRKAFEAERGRHGGKLMWKCIRDIQRGRRGLVPTRSATVRDEDGASCCSTEAQNEIWRRHFSNILSVQSEFSLEELGRVEQRPLRPELAELPTEDELMEAS